MNRTKHRSDAEVVPKTPAATAEEDSGEAFRGDGENCATPPMLERWGRSTDQTFCLLQPLQDGYWTPWHLAAEAVSAAVAAEREAIDRMLDHRSHQIDGLSDACSFAAEVLRDMRKQIRAMGPK